jgi:RNA polymerase sigma factor (sigma-70 family)
VLLRESCVRKGRRCGGRSGRIGRVFSRRVPPYEQREQYHGDAHHGGHGEEGRDLPELAAAEDEVLHRAARAAMAQVAQVDHDAGEAVAVRTAVSAVPRRQRDVMVMRVFHHWSVAETAMTLGISEGAVKQLAHRAMATLRDAFQPEGSEDG